MKKSGDIINKSTRGMLGEEKLYGLQRYAVYLIGAAFLLLYLNVVVLQYEVYPTQIIENVENGQATFTARFNYIEWIVPVNEDPDMVELLAEHDDKVRMTIHFIDAEGNVKADITLKSGEIETNGYILIPGILTEEGRPFYLTPGEEYTLQYWCYVDNVLIEDGLCFVLFGMSESMDAEAIGLIVLTLLLMIGVRLTERGGGSEKDTYRNDKLAGSKVFRVALNREDVYSGNVASSAITRLLHSESVGYFLIFLSVAGVILFTIPMMNEWEAERTAFADAYALSSSILGRETVTSDGYVYIEESGIRNMRFMDYQASLHRFWTVWEDGNVRLSGKTSTIFRESGNMPSLLTWIDAIAIALARVWNAPYQLVYLSGKLANLSIGCVLYLSSIHTLHKMDRRENRLTSDSVSGDKTELYRRKRSPSSSGRLYHNPFMMLSILLFLLPSVMQGLLSYQSYGLLTVVGYWLLLKLQKQLRYPKIYYYWILIAAGALCCVAGIARIVQAGEDVSAVVMNTITADADVWLRNVTCLWPEESSRMRVSCGIVVSILIVLWILCQKQFSARKAWRWNTAGIITIAVCCVSIMLSGTISWSDSGQVVLNAVPSMLLLPLLLLPMVRPARRSERLSYSRSTAFHFQHSYQVDYLWELIIIFIVFVSLQIL